MFETIQESKTKEERVSIFGGGCVKCPTTTTKQAATMKKGPENTRHTDYTTKRTTTRTTTMEEFSWNTKSQESTTIADMHNKDGRFENWNADP